MPATFEQIYAALFSLVSSSASFVTSSRRLRHWSDVPAEEQPALFMAAGDMEPRVGGNRTPGMPYRWSLRARIWIYANTAQDDRAVPSTIVNPLVTAVISTLVPATPGDRITLDGLVYNVFLAGIIATDEGLLGPQAIAVIPVEILTGEI